MYNSLRRLSIAAPPPYSVPCSVVERSNLLNMLKISIKGLIDSSMRLGRTLTDDHPQLQQFLILMELTMKHRMKSKPFSSLTLTRTLKRNRIDDIIFVQHIYCLLHYCFKALWNSK